MYGHITKFRDDIEIGVIAADDGRKYRFPKSEIVNANSELTGQGVDFLVVDNRPRQIIVMTGTPWTVFAAACQTQSLARE